MIWTYFWLSKHTYTHCMCVSIQYFSNYNKNLVEFSFVESVVLLKKFLYQFLKILLNFHMVKSRFLQNFHQNLIKFSSESDHIVTGNLLQFYYNLTRKLLEFYQILTRYFLDFIRFLIDIIHNYKYYKHVRKIKNCIFMT